MTTLTQRIEHAIADKGLGIGDAWNLLSEALEYIERLEADARRYQWLRDESLMASPVGGYMTWAVNGTGHADAGPIFGAELDAAIDAAIAGDKP